ncbi:hypothetical protein ACFLXG_02215 [Chloroflexota bacterium]
MTLSCCRHSYEEPMWRQDKVSFIRAHENAFLDFGGVPHIVRLNNLKAGVAQYDYHSPSLTLATTLRVPHQSQAYEIRLGHFPRLGVRHAYRHL